MRWTNVSNDVEERHRYHHDRIHDGRARTSPKNTLDAILHANFINEQSDESTIGGVRLSDCIAYSRSQVFRESTIVLSNEIPLAAYNQRESCKTG